MLEMTGDQDVSRFAPQPVANPFGRIVRLKISRRRQFGQRVRRAPERFGRLASAQLAAVPDDGGPGATPGRFSGDSLDCLQTLGGQRPSRIDLGTDRIAVMNEKEFHAA